jgi:hypothetical protein
MVPVKFARMFPKAAVGIALGSGLACTNPSPPPAQPPELAVRISMFYASPPNPPLGEKTLVCYGVEHATEVRLEPPIEQVWPTVSRCFDFVPKKPSTLKLTASGKNQSVTQALEISPGAPRVHIIEVSINALEVKRGERVTVCHKTRNAKSVDIRPGTWIPTGRSLTFGCVSDQPQQDTTYVVTATGADGDTDTERVTARVK